MNQRKNFFKELIGDYWRKIWMAQWEIYNMVHFRIKNNKERIGLLEQNIQQQEAKLLTMERGKEKYDIKKDIEIWRKEIVMEKQHIKGANLTIQKNEETIYVLSEELAVLKDFTKYKPPKGRQ